MRGGLFGAWLVGLLAIPVMADDYVALPGHRDFASVLPADGVAAPAHIAPFKLRREPVTNAEFLVFVTRNPQWRRDHVAAIFADGRYLSHWAAPDVLGKGVNPRQPVTRVSWFAAEAYCESEGGRLPLWYEWEYAAAADARHPDARSDVMWREQVLSWYARPSNTPLPRIGGSANYYGVRDINGLVWEWVADFNALLVSGDSREQGDRDVLRFCGAGAISLQQRENYATLMRVAMLSSLKASDTTNNLGFRCARTAN